MVSSQNWRFGRVARLQVKALVRNVLERPGRFAYTSAETLHVEDVIVAA